MLDHIRAAHRPSRVGEVVVLDEADEMLDMGFAEDLEAIWTRRPRPADGAVLGDDPPRIASIAAKHLRTRRDHDRPGARRSGESARVRQVATSSRARTRWRRSAACSTSSTPRRRSCSAGRAPRSTLTETLNARGYRAEALHGGISQQQRDRVMKSFRAARRPADRDRRRRARARHRHVSHVVNYDVPAAAEAYVHRIGRNGPRRGEGVAITLAEPREHRLLATSSIRPSRRSRSVGADGGRSPAGAWSSRAPRSRDDPGGGLDCVSAASWSRSRRSST
jgi:ATP-dependent RNA helicase DeaD